MIKVLSFLALANFFLPAVQASVGPSLSGEDGREVCLEIFEGLSVEPLAFKFQALEKGRWEATIDKLHVSVQVHPRGELQEWVVRLENRGAEDLRLQPQLIWHVPSLDSFESYWDGSQKSQKLSEISDPLAYDNLRDMAPWAGLLGNKRALFIGSDPGQILSFVRSAFVKSTGDRANEVSFAVREVVPPFSTREIRLFSADLAAPFGGERELVQRVHDAYSEWFQPDPAAPSSVWGVGAHYWMSGKRIDDIPGQAPMEFLRRMHVSWEWSYAPFKRAGDHWGEAQWWDYTPLVPFGEKKNSRMGDVVDFSSLSRDEFFQRREQYFNRFRGGFGFMFYTPFAAWVEISLAQSEYADAIIRDPNHKFDLKYWVTGYDRELLILPWFTSFEPVLKRQFKQIAEAYDIHGFAFDVALGGARYRGPATKRADAPRAYDEQGDFIDLGAAGAEVLNYVKTLDTRFEPHGRLATVINGMRTFNSAVRGDYGMLEGTPYFSGREQIPLSRYLFGQKPSTWWKGWAYTRFAVPNWQRYDQAHFEKTMKGLVDYTLFNSFEWGNLPTLNYEFGVPKLTDHVPILIETMKRGWQGVFPVDFAWEGSVHTGRYGKGLQTRLFWGNPYEESRQISADIDNAYLGASSQVFASRLNGPAVLNNKLSEHRTRFDISIPSRTPLLLDAVAGLPADFRGDVAASLKVTPFFVESSLRLVTTTSSRVTIEFPMLAGYDAPVLMVNGQKYESTAKGNIVSCTLDLTDKPLDITSSYASSLFFFTQTQLDQFPVFTENFDPGFSVITNSLEELAKLSNDVKLREFVRFYAAVVKEKKNPEPLKITTKEATGAKWRIRFEPQSQQPRVSMPTSEEVEFVVRDAAELQAVLNRFLALLDERFPYHPGFIGTWGMDPNLLRHVNMMGKSLESK